MKIIVNGFDLVGFFIPTFLEPSYPYYFYGFLQPNF